MAKCSRRLGLQKLHKSKTVEPVSISGQGGGQFKEFVKESMCFMWPMASIAEDIDRELDISEAVEDNNYLDR